MFFIFIKRNNNRVKIVLFIFIAIFAILIVRLFKLQLYPNTQVVSQMNTHQTENVTDNDIVLLDTNNKELLSYKNKYIVVIDRKPFSLNNYETTIEDLMAFNFIMKSELSNFNFTDVLNSNGKVYYQVSEETYNKIKQLKNIKGVYEYTRQDLTESEAGDISSFLVKSVNSANLVDGSLQSQIKKYTENNQVTQENFYLDQDSVYSIDELYQNDQNRKLQLTIDDNLQTKIYNLLNSSDYAQYKNIGVCLLESNTGAIRAMVQKDKAQSNINLGLEGSGFEPGSIFKLITYGSALEEGKINPTDTFKCTGQICKVNHGILTVNSAFEKSCNDIFAQIGAKVSYKDLMGYAEKLGLYQRTLDIQGETTGIEPKESDGINNISIGQCSTVSPIQMVSATNAIVNDGVYVKPYLIQNVLNNDNNIVTAIKPEKNRVFSKTTSDILKTGMDNVVLNGTGKEAKIPNIKIGGKTGSATTNDKKTHAWFTGYFVYNNKTYTMIVFVPNIEGKDKNGEDLGGGNTAAPIFAEIVKKIMQNNR